MTDKKEIICDICGNEYPGNHMEDGEYLNICENCSNDRSSSLPLITEDTDISQIPESVYSEIDGRGGNDD